MKTENIIESKPPYVAFKTFTNFIASLRQSGLPGRIDRSVFVGVSGANQSFLLATLKFFGLINNDGIPTPSFKDLVENPQNEKAVLSKAAKEKYDFIFDGTFNIGSATAAQLTEKFKERGIDGSTIVKAISFFTSLCEATEIKISPHLKSKRGAKGSGGSTPRKYKKRKPVDEPPFTTLPPPPLPPGAEAHTLFLDTDKQRKVSLTAPLSITRAEYSRICKWLEVALIVEEEKTK
ncbi:MAG TPA: DUF5343 domain-containing protein [Candidatus Aquilonibacter sp.]|nr:DUF5343 domain-containing protein [Candidatus Aquilonibacter sp.]